MRCIAAVLAILFATSALAKDASARLFGSWRLISFRLKVVGEDGEPKDVFGPNPIGRIIFSPSIVSWFSYRGPTGGLRRTLPKPRLSCPQ